MVKRDIIIPAKKVIEIPLSLQAAAKFVEKHKGREDDAILNAMANAASTISDAAEHIKSSTEKILANQMADPLKNVANARRRVKEIADSSAARVTSTRDKIELKIAELEAATLPSPRKDTVGAIAAIEAAEVRTMLRSVSPDKRLKVVRDAIESADAPFVAAAISGSSHLSGLSQAETAIARDLWGRRHHTNTVERVERLKGALGQLDRVSALFSKWSGEILSDKSVAVAAAERSAELAAVAMKSSGTGKPAPGTGPNWNNVDVEGV
jgi:hypothetical protein